MYKLYSMQRSGNSYKVRLALTFLTLPYRAIEIDILRGASRTPDFLAKNPSGQVPLLEVAEGRYLAESNAILWYVTIGTALAPNSPMERAETLQWMFFEQHALEPNIGAAYSGYRWSGGPRLQFTRWKSGWSAAMRPSRLWKTISEPMTFSPLGSFPSPTSQLMPTPMSPPMRLRPTTFPSIRSWLRRVEQQPGFVTMDGSAAFSDDAAVGIARA